MLRRKHGAEAEAGTFEAITDAVVDRLYAAALRLVRSEADAEDLVQETLLRGLQAYPRFDPNGNLRAYLHRVLMNVFINRYRHRRIAQRVADLAAIGLLEGSLYSEDSMRVWSDPVARFSHTHLSARLEEALDSLPDRFREVLVMADLMEFSYAEIAAQLGIPVGTVMSRLFRARHHLRDRLVTREEPARAPAAAEGGRAA